MIHVVVADNRTVRVFEARPPRYRLEEVIVFRNDELGKHERDLKSDRPGRVISGGSGIHHSYEPGFRPSEHAKQLWFKTTGPSLRSFLVDRRCDALVLVAAPRTLNLLRTCLTPSLRGLVRAELPRDLAQYTPSVLRRRLLPTVRAMLRTSTRASAAPRTSSQSRVAASR